MTNEADHPGLRARIETLTQQNDMLRDALKGAQQELREAQEMIGAQARIQAATERQRRDRRRRFIEDTASRVFGSVLIARQGDSIQSRGTAALAGDAVLLARALADDIDDLFETKPAKGDG